MQAHILNDQRSPRHEETLTQANVLVIPAGTDLALGIGRHYGSGNTQISKEWSSATGRGLRAGNGLRRSATT